MIEKKIIDDLIETVEKNIKETSYKSKEVKQALTDLSNEIRDIIEETKQTKIQVGLWLIE